ncbi:MULTISPECIES: hypothetical protein [unclassified Streptomyces]|uniref:hypothetical protein n=1 Tax=unclassified Streptomyces TaxID=2593676 RepID=UPI0023651FB8|nr:MULTISPECIES: hypothetical protein [unclassified Streptomyces]MDF3141066.1 hypothetical protein [Streptomyces sp. T21Q-yed]WDF45051.1 hypothetical protein PBV52_51035 [Streptomyces sp. T12]
MKNTLLKAQTTVALQAAALRTRLTDAHEEIKTRGDRGDSPVSTVIIIVAAIVGALLIAGGLAALYAKANGKLGDIDLG